MSLFILILTSVTWIFSVDALSAEEKTIIIGLIGDSTVATTYGWGTAFAERFRDEVTVLNYAKNGATLESLSRKLDELIDQKPDYVLIQFGHNDMKRYVSEAYGRKLEDYIDRIQQVGSQPIVLSSVTRRVFDENGKISPREIEGRTLPAFAKVAKAVASKKSVPFIDLNTISIEHHNRIGPEASAVYNFEETDRTHFSNKGAKATADLILAELKNVVPALQRHIIEK